eukprot:scaffold7052_cov254-Pinguiococcus_pyrenoidosus.AAC.91
MQLQRVEIGFHGCAHEGRDVIQRFHTLEVLLLMVDERSDRCRLPICHGGVRIQALPDLGQDGVVRHRGVRILVLFSLCVAFSQLAIRRRLAHKDLRSRAGSLVLASALVVQLLRPEQLIQHAPPLAGQQVWSPAALLQEAESERSDAIPDANGEAQMLLANAPLKGGQGNSCVSERTPR